MNAQLLRSIEEYLHNRQSLREIEAWVLENLQLILDSGDQSAIWLVNQVDGDLIEWREGLLDEAALRQRLNDHLAGLSLVPSRHYEILTHSDSGAIAIGGEDAQWQETEARVMTG